MQTYVDCYAGYRGEEIPRRFKADGNDIEVKEILLQFRTPNHRIFKVLGSNHFIYLLKYNEKNWHWSIEKVL